MHLTFVYSGAHRRAAAALGLLAGAILTACGGGQDGSPTSEAAATATATSIDTGAAADAGADAVPLERRQIASTDTTTWSFLASEYQVFSLSGTRTVRYGAGAAWITKAITGSGSCTNQFFGGDPVVGVVKQCQVASTEPVASTTTGTWTFAASENQTFRVDGTRTARYGADSRWISKSVTGTVGCSNSQFGGDPAPGIVKQCQLLSSTTATTTTPTTGTRSGMAMNLDQPAYWNTAWPFINEFKRASPFTPRCSPYVTPTTCRDFVAGGSPNNTLEHAKIRWDENGYPMRIPAADDPTLKYRMVSSLLFQGGGGSHVAGRYVVLYDGEGTLEYAGTVRKLAAESRPGRDVLDIPSDPSTSVTVHITATNETNHLRNIRFIGPGGTCSGAPRTWVPDAGRCPAGTFRSLEAMSATQSVHPAIVGDLSGFRALRFMDWAASNTSRIANWSERPRPGHSHWTHAGGVPFETMFELARATGADPWANVPAFVTDDFVVQFARLAKASLAPGATLYFEYGNEPWNQAPPYSVAGVMFEEKARSKWPTATLPAWQLRLNWYAYRSVQLCRIVKAEFGADASRVKCVANSQAANPEVSKTVLACDLAKAELGASCGRRLDALAIAPYFGYYISDAYPTQIDAWTNEPDGGLNKMFSEITGRDAAGNLIQAPLYTATGGRTPRDGALAETRRWIAASKAVADAYGLPMLAYEAGQHLQTYRGGKVEALFRAANRDPRMGAALKQLNADWKAGGGQLFVAYSYVQRAVGGGAWGAKEHQRDDAAAKWVALKSLRDAGCWWSGC